jgi:hypothetical protein
VMKLFLEFLRFFNAQLGHNMMVIMSNPHLKALFTVENLVKHGDAI